MIKEKIRDKKDREYKPIYRLLASDGGTEPQVKDVT